tara:strand:- start:51 stop:407 length:357 start_codon:yes stop_codon:yes gene_type:complete
MINFNKFDYNTLKTKNEVIQYLGKPNYIDPIEKKYYYYNEKKITKNFFQTYIEERKLIVYNFDSIENVLEIKEYDLNDENEVVFIEEETSGEVLEKGLLEKIFGGVGTYGTPSTTPTN